MSERNYLVKFELIAYRNDTEIWKYPNSIYTLRNCSTHLPLFIKERIKGKMGRNTRVLQLNLCIDHAPGIGWRTANARSVFFNGPNMNQGLQLNLCIDHAPGIGWRTANARSVFLMVQRWTRGLQLNLALITPQGCWNTVNARSMFFNEVNINKINI